MIFKSKELYLLDAGTRTSSMITWRVGWQFHPILSSLAPKDSPGMPFSRTMQEMESPVRHITRYRSDRPAGVV